MPLSQAHKVKIDEMIANNAKTPDILQELIANHGANARAVTDYVTANKTLQGMMKTITHRTKDVISAEDDETRKQAAKEIEALSKKAIRILQQRPSA